LTECGTPLRFAWHLLAVSGSPRTLARNSASDHQSAAQQGTTVVMPCLL